MAQEDWQFLKYKLIGLVGSRKFWVMLFAALFSVGVDIPPAMQAFVIVVATSVFMTTTAWEDNVSRKAEAVMIPQEQPEQRAQAAGFAIRGRSNGQD